MSLFVFKQIKSFLVLGCFFGIVFSNQLPCALHFCSYLEEELSQMPQRGAWKHDEALWWAFLRERFYRLRAADFKAQQVPLISIPV